MHGDTNATFYVGDVDPVSRRLTEVTEECMWHGIEAVVPGRPLSDIGKAIEQHAKQHRYGVVRAFIGHGIGEQFHTDVQVFHYYEPRANMIMRPGMTFTIEPMITLGTWQHRMWDDGWTAVTTDGKRTAQYEHTVLVTDTGVDVLTGGPGAVSPVAPWHRDRPPDFGNQASTRPTLRRDDRTDQPRRPIDCAPSNRAARRSWRSSSLIVALGLGGVVTIGRTATPMRRRQRHRRGVGCVGPVEPGGCHRRCRVPDDREPDRTINSPASRCRRTWRRRSSSTRR